LRTEDIDLLVDDNVTIFKRIMGDTGPRMDEILRQTFYALLERSGSTLLDIERLLVRNDASFRQRLYGQPVTRRQHIFLKIPIHHTQKMHTCRSRPELDDWSDLGSCGRFCVSRASSNSRKAPKRLNLKKLKFGLSQR
jgi:hypothetical protein